MRDAAVFQDALAAVDVLQEQVQRRDALRQAALDTLPFRVGQDARHQVEGEQPLGAASIAVNGEGDALHQKGEVRQLPALLKLRRRHVRQLGEQPGVMGPRLPRPDEHLVIERAGVVALKQPGFQLCLRRSQTSQPTEKTGAEAN